MTLLPRAEAEREAWKLATEKLVAAITLHHERIRTLGLNNHRGVPQWGGPWDHELWATVGLPAGPEEGERGTLDVSRSTPSEPSREGDGEASLGRALTDDHGPSRACSNGPGSTSGGER